MPEDSLEVDYDPLTEMLALVDDIKVEENSE